MCVNRMASQCARFIHRVGFREHVDVEQRVGGHSFRLLRAQSASKLVVDKMNSWRRLNERAAGTYFVVEGSLVKLK